MEFIKRLLKGASLVVGLLILAAVLAYLLSRIEVIGSIEAINISVLLVTAMVVGIQSFATRKLAEYQVMPAVDVGMRYMPNVGKTYFWFSNASDVPAIVILQLRWSEYGKRRQSSKRKC